MFNLNLGTSISNLNDKFSSEIFDFLNLSSIKTIEINDWLFEQPESEKLCECIQAKLEASGKKIISYHNPFMYNDDVSAVDEKRRINALNGLLERLRKSRIFKCKYLVLHPSTEPINQNERQLHIKQLRKSLRYLLPQIEKYDMYIAVEWLPRLCIGNSLEGLLEIIDSLGPRVGVCLDVNHLMDKYDQLPQVIKTFGDKLFNLHICDYDGIDEKHFLPGDGVIDWHLLVQALKDISYKGPFNYECEWRYCGNKIEERITTIENNFNNLKQLIK